MLVVLFALAALSWSVLQFVVRRAINTAAASPDLIATAISRTRRLSTLALVVGLAGALLGMASPLVGMVAAQDVVGGTAPDQRATALAAGVNAVVNSRGPVGVLGALLAVASLVMVGFWRGRLTRLEDAD